MALHTGREAVPGQQGKDKQPKGGMTLVRWLFWAALALIGLAGVAMFLRNISGVADQEAKDERLELFARNKAARQMQEAGYTDLVNIGSEVIPNHLCGATDYRVFASVRQPIPGSSRVTLVCDCCEPDVDNPLANCACWERVE
ncbi:MAG: hypothetical protein PHT12_02880 [Patescibacteria group bacterium]|nr:hypothetical protein [Patescibacteria group bacterium]